MICKKYLYPKGCKIQFIEQNTGNAHDNHYTSITYGGATVLSNSQGITTDGISYSSDFSKIIFDSTWIGRTVTFVDEQNQYKNATFTVPSIDGDVVIYLIGAFMSAILKWCDGKPPTSQDLDSHLIVWNEEDNPHTKTAYANYADGHVNTELPVGDNAYISLDTDDLPGAGTHYKHADVDYAVETSSLYLRSGTWNNNKYTTKFYVHFYTGSGTISSMGARVEVTFDDGTSQTIYPPTVQNGELWWHVFTYDSTGFHTINQLSSSVPEGCSHSGGA